jgi:hypothetical protein
MSFPETRPTLVAALAGDDDESQHRAFELFAQVYRAPIVTLLERRWQMQRADAEDSAHEFLAAALVKDWLPRFDPSKGRFRTFLRSCLSAFVLSEKKDASRLKRGGDTEFVSIEAAPNIAHDQDGPDEIFEKEWVRSVLSTALAALESECAETGREAAFAVFRSYDIDAAESGERPTYAVLATKHGIPVTQVTNNLAWSRRRFRALVMYTVRELSGSEREYREDLRSLLGAGEP